MSLKVDISPWSHPTTQAPPTVDKATRRSITASTVGNVLEWFEWSIYAVFAPYIAQLMFNPANKVSALLSTLAVFAVGFLMRPLGGFVFGRLADAKGRKFVLITTMLLMASGSVIIGVMPTYSTIGIGASAILLTVRVIQGFAHGGESAASNSYVAEIAPDHRRGLWSSIPFMAIFAGSVLAYTVGGIITSIFDDEAVLAGAWRIPFLLSAIMAVVALWMRRHMVESDVFEHTQEEPGVVEEDNANTAQSNPDLEWPATGAIHPIKKHSVWKSILLVIAMTSGLTAAHYTWSSYISTYAITQHGMKASSAFWMTVIAQVIALISLPFWGHLSDKIGRRPLLLGFAVAMFLTQMPLMSMVSSRPWTVLVAASVALVIVSMAGAIIAAVMSEVFPTKYRTQSIGFAYSISVAAFGGSAPYLNDLVVSWDMNWLSNVYIMLLCVATFAASYMLPETKGVDLKKV